MSTLKKNSLFSIIVTKTTHSLKIRIPANYGDLAFFLSNKCNDVSRNLDLLNLIAQYQKAEDVILSWNLIDELNQNYKGDLQEELNEYLDKNDNGFLFSENSFVFRRLKNDNNRKLLVLLLNNFNDLDKNYIHIYDETESLYINSDYCFRCSSIDSCVQKFSTSELVGLLLDINQFLDSYNKGELLGLSPVELLTDNYSIRIPRLDFDISIESNFSYDMLKGAN